MSDIPVGSKEVAEILGVKHETVHIWHHRKLLPERDFTVGGRPAWWLDATILPWAQETGRISADVIPLRRVEGRRAA